MNAKILVTYASRNGSTAGVAEAIGKTLAQCGTQVDVLPMNAVKDLATYQAVVAGSAIQAGQWLPEAQKFVQTYRAGLNQRPTAIFTVHGLNLGDDETSRAQRQTYLTQVRNFVHARTEGFFAGTVDLSKLKFFERALAKAVKAAGASRLDLDAVRRWTEDAYGQLLAAEKA